MPSPVTCPKGLINVSLVRFSEAWLPSFMNLTSKQPLPGLTPKYFKPLVPQSNLTEVALFMVLHRVTLALFGGHVPAFRCIFKSPHSKLKESNRFLRRSLSPKSALSPPRRHTTDGQLTSRFSSYAYLAHLERRRTTIRELINSIGSFTRPHILQGVS